MDDVIGDITGTGTYEMVRIEDADGGELFEVTGYYEDSATTYRTPRLMIAGLTLEGHIDGQLTMENDAGRFVWVHAEGDRLTIEDSE